MKFVVCELTKCILADKILPVNTGRGGADNLHKAARIVEMEVMASDGIGVYQ